MDDQERYYEEKYREVTKFIVEDFPKIAQSEGDLADDLLKRLI